MSVAIGLRKKSDFNAEGDLDYLLNFQLKSIFQTCLKQLEAMVETPPPLILVHFLGT